MSAANLLMSKLGLEGHYKSATSRDRLVQRKVNIECVKGLMIKSIQRLRISVVLPLIFENFDSFKKVVLGTQYERSIKIVNDFIQRRGKLIDRNSAPSADRASIKLIDYFLEHHAIYDILPLWKYNLDTDDTKLLNVMHMLNEIACLHLDSRGIKDIEIERKLHQQYQNRIELRLSIQELTKKLYRQKLRKRWITWAKLALYQRRDGDILMKRYNIQMHINKEVTKCHHEVRFKHRNFLDSQKELEEELEGVEREYESVRAKNLKSEKEARSEKNKVLLQLEGQLKKYDQVIGERLRETLVLDEELQEWKKKIDDFMILYQQEEAVYKDIVVKREEEERRWRQRRIYYFKVNRAARIIQRYVRNWLKWQRKKAKMFGRKRK